MVYNSEKSIIKYKFLNQYNYIVMKATDTISKIKNILGMELSKEVKEVEVKAEEVTLSYYES